MSEASVEVIKLVVKLDDLKMFAIINADEVEIVEEIEKGR